jgi:hypothetical protein
MRKTKMIVLRNTQIFKTEKILSKWLMVEKTWTPSPKLKSRKKWKNLRGNLSLQRREQRARRRMPLSRNQLQREVVRRRQSCPCRTGRNPGPQKDLENLSKPLKLSRTRVVDPRRESWHTNKKNDPPRELGNPLTFLRLRRVKLGGLNGRAP